MWLNNQLAANNNVIIDTKEQKLLDDLGNGWDILEQKWKNFLNLLVKYKEYEVHCNVPQFHKEDGQNLGKWRNHQCTVKNKGRIDNKIQKLLDDLGVVLDAFNWQLETYFNLLVKYKNHEGHCNVPISHK